MGLPAIRSGWKPSFILALPLSLLVNLQAKKYHAHSHSPHLLGTLAGSSAMAWPQFDVVYKRGITLSVAKRSELVLNFAPSCGGAPLDIIKRYFEQQATPL